MIILPCRMKCRMEGLVLTRMGARVVKVAVTVVMGTTNTTTILITTTTTMAKLPAATCCLLWIPVCWMLMILTRIIWQLTLTGLLQVNISPIVIVLYVTFLINCSVYRIFSPNFYLWLYSIYYVYMKNLFPYNFLNMLHILLLRFFKK